jgi:hypothetical protein
MVARFVCSRLPGGSRFIVSFRQPEDRHQRVVEIVRNAAGEFATVYGAGILLRLVEFPADDRAPAPVTARGESPCLRRRPA